MLSFRPLFGLLPRLLLVAAALSLFSLTIHAQPYPTGGVCYIFYGAPGTIDYPWSVTVSLNLLYDPTVQSNANGQYYNILSGDARYTFTNKSGIPTELSVQQMAGSQPLYINSALPVDSAGTSFLVAPRTRAFQSFQLPGVGPKQSFGYIMLTNSTAGQSAPYVQLGSAFTIDTASQAWVSSIPGFVSRTIGPASLNAAAVDYTNCVANVTVNRAAAVTSAPANTATQFSYSYSISDGATYSVNTTLAITTTATPQLYVDQLGNSYQNITSVSGTRVYTHLPTGATVISAVTGLSNGAGTPSQRWYPFAYLQSAPGVYSTSTAPYLDGEGIGFTISPAAPVNGNAPGAGAQNSIINVRVAAPNTVSYATLTELSYVTAPLSNQQQQTYTF